MDCYSIQQREDSDEQRWKLLVCICFAYRLEVELVGKRNKIVFSLGQLEGWCHTLRP